ncbi:MAG: hypothetical protein R3F49_24405 [Planctomycetota bacterium]
MTATPRRIPSPFATLRALLAPCAAMSVLDPVRSVRPLGPVVLVGLLATLGLTACASPPTAGASRLEGAGRQGADRSDPGAPAPQGSAAIPASAGGAEPRSLGPTAWTKAFEASAVVVADHIRIEGPDGLLEHVVVSSDDAFYDRVVTHEGGALVQVTTRLSADVPEIRAQLDNWQFAAFQRVTIVEHLGARDVTVVATGDASYRDPLGAEEYGETLRWAGTIEE